MVKVWGRSNSVNVQKVMWCIGELGLAHERVDAGLSYGKNREDWYLQRNPNGLIPLLEDDDFTVWESNTIVRYLAAQYDTRGLLYPPNPQQRANAECWMDWQLTVQSPPLTTVFWTLVRLPPEQRDETAYTKAVAKCDEVFTLLNQHLSRQPYMAGSQFTVGDIPVGAMTYRWYQLPLAHPELPHLRAWYERLCERPAYREQVMLPLS
jgi:glutathione S-transferase